MEYRCSNAIRLGVGHLQGWRFLIMSRGYATIVPEPGSVVWGVLWDLREEDIASLDRYEGVHRGFYYKEMMSISDSAGGEKDALVYIASDTEPGMPGRDYIERIIAAAEVAGFPEGYLAELEVWRTL